MLGFLNEWKRYDIFFLKLYLKVWESVLKALVFIYQNTISTTKLYFKLIKPFSKQNYEKITKKLRKLLHEQYFRILKFIKNTLIFYARISIYI